MKNLMKNLNKKLEGREIIFLSTFINSKKAMSSRIEFKRIELAALNGSISIASNGTQVVRVFFKGRYFSVDALWDIFKYDAPYFNIKRVKILGNKHVNLKHLQYLRNEIKMLDLKNIKDTIYLLNIAANNFNTFAAYEVLNKRIFVDKIKDIDTRIAVNNAIKNIKGGETYNIPEYLKGYKYISNSNQQHQTESNESNNNVSTDNIITTSWTLKKIMLMAHKFRKQRESKDADFKALSYSERMSISLKKIWAMVPSDEEPALNLNNISANTTNNITNNETTKEQEAAIDKTISDETKDDINSNIQKDNNIIELHKMKNLPDNMNMNNMNSIKCRTSSNSLYIEAYSTGFTVEHQDGRIITLYPSSCSERRDNTLKLTSRNNFPKIFQKLFKTELKQYKKGGIEVFDLPQVLYDGKLYNIIIMGHQDRFPSYLKSHVILADQF